MLNNEIWKDIPGYEGLYQVSNLGIIKSLHYGKNKMLAGGMSGNYKGIHLCKKGKNKSKYIHRIVLESFEGYSKLTVNHKDGNKLNNNISNLEYVTQAYNNKHAFDIGLKVAKRGSENSLSKKVGQYSVDGDFIQSFGSAREASRILNMFVNNIIMVCNGKNRTCGGFIFKYI